MDGSVWFFQPRARSGARSGAGAGCGSRGRPGRDRRAENRRKGLSSARRGRSPSGKGGRETRARKRGRETRGGKEGGKRERVTRAGKGARVPNTARAGPPRQIISSFIFAARRRRRTISLTFSQVPLPPRQRGRARKPAGPPPPARSLGGSALGLWGAIQGSGAGGCKRLGGICAARLGRSSARSGRFGGGADPRGAGSVPPCTAGRARAGRLHSFWTQSRLLYYPAGPSSTPSRRASARARSRDRAALTRATRFFTAASLS